MSKKIVTHDDIIEDVVKARKGNVESMENILLNLEHIIEYTIKKISSFIKNHNLEYEDIFQELRLELVQAVYKFDNKKNPNFISYVFTHLRYSAFKFITDNVSFISQADFSKGTFVARSLNEEINSDEGVTFLMDAIIDEDSTLVYNILEDSINDSESNIRQILRLFISDTDIDFLYKFYGVGNEILSMNEISNFYNKPINKIIAYERLIIITLKNNERLYDYYEQLMSNVSVNYNYSLNRFKNTFTSSTEYSALKNIYLTDKIVKIINEPTVNVLHRNIIEENKDFEFMRMDLTK